jgi:hypothetical protein
VAVARRLHVGDSSRRNRVAGPECSSVLPLVLAHMPTTSPAGLMALARLKSPASVPRSVWIRARPLEGRLKGSVQNWPSIPWWQAQPLQPLASLP